MNIRLVRQMFRWIEFTTLIFTLISLFQQNFIRAAICYVISDAIIWIEHEIWEESQ